MSSWNNLNKAALPPFLIFLLALTGCSEQPIPSLKGGPSTSQLDASEARDTAEFLCRYTRGSFPNWHLWPEYQQFLKPEEKNAIQYVSERLLQNIAPSRRPKFLAMFSFLAAHTQCAPNMDAAAPNATRDETGAEAFSFLQSLPIIPNIPEISISEFETAEEQFNRWRKAFDRAYHGEVQTRSVTIVVEPVDGHYRLRSEVAKSYEEPLKTLSFWKMLDEYRFSDALENLSVICAQNAEKCTKLRAYFDSAVLWQQIAAQQFSEDVEISDVQMTNIALTGLSSYTAVQIKLSNRSLHTYSDIQLRTDESEPQTCILQTERTKLDDHPLTLHGGDAITAWCALNSSTKPWTQLKFWIADIQ